MVRLLGPRGDSRDGLKTVPCTNRMQGTPFRACHSRWSDESRHDARAAEDGRYVRVETAA